MMDDIHIPTGISVQLLLVGLVLASGVVGALGLAPTTSQAAVGGAADDPVTAAFPINNVTVGASSQQLSLDGKGNDPWPAALSSDDVRAAFPINNVTTAFPIDNVTASGGPWDVKDTDRMGGTGIGSADMETWGLASLETPDELPQDMDPY